MLNATEVFQLFVRMNNAKILCNTKEEREEYILSILKYIDEKGLLPFSTQKGFLNYPVEYDCNCINKFRKEFNLPLYIYKEGIGILKST